MARSGRENPNPGDKSKGETGLSVIAPGMRINGAVDTNGVVKVEGTVVGSVRAERQVLVAKGGTVEGDIMTVEAVIGGAVRGHIYSDERVEVQGTATIDGDITTKRILLEEGGEVNGQLQMAEPDALNRKQAGGSDASQPGTPPGEPRSNWQSIPTPGATPS